MKKLIALLWVMGLFSSLVWAQPSLNFDVHQLKSGEDNSMSYCKFADPGAKGENQVWDFSELEFERSFTGYVQYAGETEMGSDFAGSTTELQEFNSHFFFRVADNKIEQYGYSSADGKIQTRYDIPYVKMKYPFSYGEIFSGSFSGATYYSGIEKGSVIGNYTIEGDAWGQLILPGNVSYDNTLRVKTEKAYATETGVSGQEVSITTYRWYNNQHRYPLLVLTEYSVRVGEKSSVKYQAAYNNQAVEGISPMSSESILLYPNPANDHLVLEYNVVAAGTLQFNIIDYNGRIIREFSQEAIYAGPRQLSLDQYISGLKPSNYILRIQNGDDFVDRSFSILD